MIIAAVRMTTGFSSSEGWNWKPAMTIQRVAPPLSSPTTSTAARRAVKNAQAPHMSAERVTDMLTARAIAAAARATRRFFSCAVRKYVELPYSLSASTLEEE